MEEQLQEEMVVIKQLLAGTSYRSPTGGTQTSGGQSVNNETNEYIGYFGKANIKAATFSTGGGGGYYGGATAKIIPNALFSGSGGSSFISGHGLCNAITESSTENAITHTGNSLHYSGKYFIFSKMLAGNENMPNTSGDGTMTGNTGNGCVKITQVYFK